MKVIVAGKEMAFEAEISVKEMFEKILWELNKKNMVISSTIVDGTEIFNNHEAYVEERMDKIQVLEVKGATKAALAMENAALIQPPIRALIPKLSESANAFRQGMTEAGWNEFEELIQTLIFIEEVVVKINNLLVSADKKVMIDGWKKVLTEYQKLADILKDLEEALGRNQEAHAG
ncbi:MAG: hypothetical protein IJC26_00665, partial [Clostridia bacterium]|nr:hypothetical protein [Clostridia bacterium]